MWIHNVLIAYYRLSVKSTVVQKQLQLAEWIGSFRQPHTGNIDDLMPHASGIRVHFSATTPMGIQHKDDSASATDLAWLADAFKNLRHSMASHGLHFL